MSNKTWKSLLHEYFQQNGLESPIYITSRIDNGMDHSPEWKCTIILSGVDKEFIGISSSKKEAGSICAKDAYQYISSKELPKEVIKHLERKQKVKDLIDIPSLGYHKGILLVDGENYNLDMNDMNKIKNTMLVLIFAAKNTTKNNIFILQENYNNCYVFLSQSVGKDAADHLLTFTAGQLSILLNGLQYYVLTKDHFGEFVGVLMNNCKFICNFNELDLNYLY